MPNDRDLEHPDIAHIERSGLPPGEDWQQACPRCDGDLSPWAYSLDGHTEICEHCFEEIARDLMCFTPKFIADALGVERRFVL